MNIVASLACAAALPTGRETLEAMSCKDAAQFIGETLITLTPELKEIFKDYFWTEGGHTPPKLAWFC